MKILNGMMLTMALVLAFALPAWSMLDGEQAPLDVKAMTIPELEKAGDNYRAQKDFDNARQCFREAVRRDKKNSILFNKLGLTELRSGMLDQARFDFEKAAKLNPKYADAHNNVGAIYYMQNRPGQAAKYFKKAVALDETRATFHVNLGAAWFSQKKLERAINEYSRALELDPGVLERNAKLGVTAQIASPEEQAKYYYMLAKIHAKHGNVDSCLVCLRKAKEGGYRDLGNVYKDEEFSRMWNDPRLAEVVPAPVAK